MSNENKTINVPTTSSLILEERHGSELSHVYTLILDGITGHVLLLGKKLTESGLCHQMTCSRDTVRSMFSLLAHDKIVDLQPNHGTFVYMPDLREMQDVFNVRVEIEGMILGMLIDLPDSEARLQPLCAMIEHGEAASGGGNHVGWGRLSSTLRVELVRLLDNDVLFDTMNTLYARSSLVVAMSDVRRHEKHPINMHTHTEHRKILDLLVNDKHNHMVKITRWYLGTYIERPEQKFEAQ